MVNSRWGLDIDGEGPHRNLGRAGNAYILLGVVVVLVSTKVEIHQAVHLGFVPFMYSPVRTLYHNRKKKFRTKGERREVGAKVGGEAMVKGATKATKRHVIGLASWLLTAAL